MIYFLIIVAVMALVILLLSISLHHIVNSDSKGLIEKVASVGCETRMDELFYGYDYPLTPMNELCQEISLCIEEWEKKYNLPFWQIRAIGPGVIDSITRDLNILIRIKMEHNASKWRRK